MEFDIKTLIKDIKGDFHKCINDIYLTNYEMEVLERNGFNVYNYRDCKDLIFAIEDALNSYYDEELDNVLYELCEFDYYHNTNK